jgi:hypothetical protein
VVAYLAAYWSHPGKITPLQGEFDAQPQASVLYLHDMAVDPALAGQGIAAGCWQPGPGRAGCSARPWWPCKGPPATGSGAVCPQPAQGYGAESPFGQLWR